MKLKYHPKEGYMEIEGDPIELGHYTSEIMRRLGHGVELRSPMAAGQTTISSDSIAKGVKSEYRSVRTKEIVDYLYSKGTTDMAHTMRELGEHFFGKVLDSKDKTSPYNRFYNRVVTAHLVIAQERNGTWESDWDIDRGGRYRVYKFVQK